MDRPNVDETVEKLREHVCSLLQEDRPASRFFQIGGDIVRQDGTLLMDDGSEYEAVVLPKGELQTLRGARELIGKIGALPLAYQGNNGLNSLLSEYDEQKKG